MRKAFKVALFTCLIILTSVFMFISCENKPEWENRPDWLPQLHIEVVDPAVPPTCNESGLTEGRHCSTCGEIYVAQEIIPPVGHTTVIDKGFDPTCTEPGLSAGTHCTVCGVVVNEQRIIPALGHSNENGHCYRCDGNSSDKNNSTNEWDSMGVVYVVSSDGTYVIVKDCYDTDTTVIISDYYNGLPVTRIEANAFGNCTNLTNLTIGKNVITIGANAFYGCKKLKTVLIPQNVTNIGVCAFGNCKSLKEITYKGTITQWKAISKLEISSGSTAYNWNFSTGSYVIYCDDGTIAKDGTVTYN